MTRDLAANGEVQARPSARELLPCCLCGVIMWHGIVEPFERARLIYRATERDGHAWVPIKHSGPLCPDPEPGTAVFWGDDLRREAYKNMRRAEAAKRWPNGTPPRTIVGGKS